MCYGRIPVKNLDGKVEWLEKSDFLRLNSEGKLVPDRDTGWQFARSTVDAFLWRQGGIVPVKMRWDLVPRFFGKPRNGRGEDPSLAEALKLKASRKKDPRTGRRAGFDSYNARSEELLDKPSFRAPWLEGRRMVLTAFAFRERPNMEGAPEEFSGHREFEVLLDQPFFMAGLWDAWSNSQGENLESCTVLTVDSLGNDKLRGIWHERCPALLTVGAAEEYLHPATPPERALSLCALLPSQHMEIKEITATRRPPDLSDLPLFA